MDAQAWRALTAGCSSGPTAMRNQLGCTPLDGLQGWQAGGGSGLTCGATMSWGTWDKAAQCLGRVLVMRRVGSCTRAANGVRPQGDGGLKVACPSAFQGKGALLACSRKLTNRVTIAACSRLLGALHAQVLKA